jgi:hypothetical protein
MNKDDDVGVVNLLKSQTSSICTLKILEYMYEEGSSKTTLKFRTFELKEKYCRIQFVLHHRHKTEMDSSILWMKPVNLHA